MTTTIRIIKTTATLLLTSGFMYGGQCCFKGHQEEKTPLVHINSPQHSHTWPIPANNITQVCDDTESLGQITSYNTSRSSSNSENEAQNPGSLQEVEDDGLVTNPATPKRESPEDEHKYYDEFTLNIHELLNKSKHQVLEIQNNSQDNNSFDCLINPQAAANLEQLVNVYIMKELYQDLSE